MTSAIYLHSYQLLWFKKEESMIYSAEVSHMCSVAKGANHGPAPIPEEGKWTQSY